MIHKKPFLEAVITTCDAMKIWSERYGNAAKDMAAKEGDAKRKADLLKIAEVCTQVPENPARNFHEALQCQWWGQLFNRIEQTSCAMGQGRMDQYLLPYYQKDLADGTLTYDDAQELLQCVWLHMSEVTEIKMNPVAAAGTEGFSQFCDVCLGGQTADGQDATNELSYAILESVRPLQITSPDLCVRIHANTPEKFLHAVVETIKDGKMAGNYFASPQTSMLHDLTMEHCRDLHTHGEWIPGGLDHSCLDSIGKGTAIDSLAVVKHLIFDTKKLTWDQLLDAVEQNWEGHEDIRQLCLNAPKYGNGINWVDKIGWDIDHFILELLHKYPKPNGQCFILRCIPITFHVPFGKVVWATPNGRPAHEYLSEGISASHGMDVKGPTVALTSMAHGRDTSYKEKGGELINMKFAPGNIAGEEGTRRLMQVIRTWSDLKLWHVQFNILNKATLLAAQKDPEKYRDLVVRIAGYSAYFVDLSPSQQSEIIARTGEAA